MSGRVTGRHLTIGARLPAATPGPRKPLRRQFSKRYRELHHVAMSLPYGIVAARVEALLQPVARSFIVKSVNEALKLFLREAQLERAMKQPGGAQVIDEQELLAVRRKLAAFPAVMQPFVGMQENDGAGNSLYG